MSYGAVHARLKSARGPASSHRCACGRRARHWSYSRECPEEQWSESGPFCEHPSCYVPACVSCNKFHDLKAGRRDRALRRKPGQMLLWLLGLVTA